MEATKDHSDALRASLMEELALMGLMGLIAQGDTLTSSELGVTVQMVDTTQDRINEETLLSLGVSKEMVDKARTKKHINPFVRISSLKIDTARPGRSPNQNSYK